MVSVNQALAMTIYPVDLAWARSLAEQSYDWCYRPDGVARQANMIRRSGDRREALRTLAIPTTIIQGLEDTAINPEAAIALASLIPGSELHLYAGMAHYVTEPLWDEFVAVIRRCVDRGVAQRAGG